MTNFSTKVILDIISAADNERVREVINDSVRIYERKTNSQLVQDYLVNMAKDLQGLGQEDLTTRAKDNVQIAILIFRELYRQRHDNSC